MSQLVNAKVNSSNRKTVLASNYATSIIVLALEMLYLVFLQPVAAFCPDYPLPRSFCHLEI